MTERLNLTEIAIYVAVSSPYSEETSVKQFYPPAGFKWDSQKLHFMPIRTQNWNEIGYEGEK